MSRNRQHFLKCMPNCWDNRCGHYVADASGKVGCELKPGCGACIDSHVLGGGGCFANPPLFLPAPKQPKREKPSGRVRITIPPTTYTPTRPYALCTVAVGRKSQELAEYTLPAMQRYADRVGADLVVLTDDHVPAYPIANKFAVEHVADAYERTLFVDIDAFIRDGAPSMFDLPAGTVYIHDDSPFNRDPNPEWQRREYEAIARQQRVPNTASKCWNTGVVLCDREHASIWSPPVRPLITSHTAEQSWIGLQLHNSGISFSTFDVRWNTQFWFHNFEKMEPEAWFIHMAAASHAERLAKFKEMS